MSLKEAIIGNERAAEILERSYENGKLAHAYLFEGPGYLGKKKLALGFSELILGRNERNIENNLDLTVLYPDKNSRQITIEEIRDLEKKLSLYPYYSKYKIAIIEQADRMSKAAANALLKTLEEPNATAVIILITSNSGNIPNTIKSRCQTIKFFPVNEKTLREKLSDGISDLSEVEKIIEISVGRPEKALELASNEKKIDELAENINKLDIVINSCENERIVEAAIISGKELDETINMFDLWAVRLRKSMINCCKNDDDFEKKHKLAELKRIIDIISKTKKDLLTKNVNYKLAIENLFLNM